MGRPDPWPSRPPPLVAELRLFPDVIEEIAARLDLREPNAEAIQTIAAEVSQWYDLDERQPPFEAVIDSATGVGKTYILAGAMELFASAYGIRDFVIVTPGRTILEKTRDNLTPGHPKSLLGPMSFGPVVVTAENFATPVMRAAMDDPSQVKVYLFTVQSLIKPEAKTGRKTREFQEGLGTEFYGHLQAVEQLVEGEARLRRGQRQGQPAAAAGVDAGARQDRQRARMAEDQLVDREVGMDRHAVLPE